MHPEIVEAVTRALAEDIGPGDVTSRACVPAGQMAAGVFLAREDQVLAGTELLPLIYQMRGGVETLDIARRDGDCVAGGDTIASVRGLATTLLECERVALNFLQR